MAKTTKTTNDKLSKLIMEKTLNSLSSNQAEEPKKAKKSTPKEEPKKAKSSEPKVVETKTVTKTTTTKKTVEREVKYIYPEDCSDSLSRKKFRQMARTKIHSFESELEKISDKKSDAYKKVLKEFESFKKQFLRA